MKKYIRLFLKNISIGFSREIQYRADTIGMFVIDLVSFASAFLFVEAIYNQTTSVGGWQKGEIYVLTLIAILQNSIFTLFFRGNFRSFEDKIHSGALDLLLTQPASALFLMSTRHVRVRSLYETIFTCISIVIALAYFDIQVSFVSIVGAVYFLAVGIVVSYAIALIINTLIFRFPRVGNINEVLYEIQFQSQYPLHVFPRKAFHIFLSIVPIAFFGYLAAAAFLDKISYPLYLYAFAFSTILFIGSISFWRRQIRYYSSASS